MKWLHTDIKDLNIMCQRNIILREIKVIETEAEHTNHQTSKTVLMKML